MSGSVCGLVGVWLIALTAVAHAAPAPAPAPDSSSEPPASAVARSSEPAPNAPPPLRLYMRTDGQPLTFSARERTSRNEPTWCVSPCNAAFAPGHYQLRLNGVLADEQLDVDKLGTLRGELHSREGSRSAGWLGLNLGGIIGGVFVTAAALGGPKWTYVAGGGSLLVGAVIFVATYHPDTATVTFTPSAPVDVRGMPEPVAKETAQLDEPGRASLAAQGRGLGFRVLF